jgi:hypothetical protein
MNRNQLIILPIAFLAAFTCTWIVRSALTKDEPAPMESQVTERGSDKVSVADSRSASNAGSLLDQQIAFQDLAGEARTSREFKRLLADAKAAIAAAMASKDPEAGQLLSTAIAASLSEASEERIEAVAACIWKCNALHSSASLPNDVWGNQDGVELLLKLPGGSFKNGAIKSALRAWGENHPEEALSWIRGSGALDTKRYYDEICYAWTRRNPNEMADYATQSGDPYLINKIGPNVVKSMSAKNPQEALNWAFEHLGPGGRATALKSVAASLSKTAPQEAIELLSDGPNPRESSAIVKGLLESWKSRNLKGAAEFVKSLKDPSLRRDGLNVLGKNWVEEDLEGAKAYLYKEGSGTLLMQHVRDKIIDSGMENALKWAKGFNDDRRPEVIEDIAYRFANRNPVSALDIAKKMNNREMKLQLVAQTISNENWKGLSQPVLARLVGDFDEAFVLEAIKTHLQPDLGISFNSAGTHAVIPSTGSCRVKERSQNR